MTSILVVAVVGLGAAVACLIMRAVMLNAVDEADKLRGQLHDATSALDAQKAITFEQKARLEAVITGLKTEVATIEAQLRTCRDPAVIRDRLRVLLSNQEDPVPG